MLARNRNGELVIIEVQNERELDYFHRILYGVSKVITEHIHKGDGYSMVKKVYSISILYFELGQGSDYLYHGRTDFRGYFTKDTLRLSVSQAERFRYSEVGDLYPEYYILRVEDFNKVAVTPLDEWFSFLKTGDIPEHATAPGLPEARERLRYDWMNNEERLAYDAQMEALRYQKSVLETGFFEGEVKGRAEGRAEGEAERELLKTEKEAAQAKLADFVINSNNEGIPIEVISKITGLAVDEIKEIINRVK
jgi:predicted transposase/invertase (TIGR01784 family)